MNNITWEQFQEAYQNADQSVKDFINSPKTADLIDILITLGLPTTAKTNTIKLIGYIKLGLLKEDYATDYFSHMSENPDISKKLLTETLLVLNGKESEISSKNEDTAPKKAAIPLATRGPKDIHENAGDKAIATGKPVNVRNPKKDTAADAGETDQTTEHFAAAEGIRTMRSDVDRLRHNTPPEPPAFTKPFSGT